MNTLYARLCSYENLLLAFKKARKHKTLKPYMIEFQKNLEDNLLQLRSDLLFHSYQPKPLKTFIVRDPKTRKICKSEFRDRVVHHALCNIIEPIFNRIFIYDSYANRKGKGTFAAIKRFDCFNNKVGKKGYCLKADIKHYFETVDHEILLKIIRRKIPDQKVIWLIKIILNNYQPNKVGKGMPLGNLTSQFLANAYLNELDQFVKHKLKVKYYIRYVDDFVILNREKPTLELYKQEINTFLSNNLLLELHPTKSKIISLKCGVDFLGFRIFYYHKLLRKSCLRRVRYKLQFLKGQFDIRETHYDALYNFLEGWLAYAKKANTYKLRKELVRELELNFPNEISTKEINRMSKKK